MWVHKAKTMSDALTQAAVDATWVATYDDAELLGVTQLADIIGTCPSGTIECTMKQKNCFFSRSSTCGAFLSCLKF